MLRRNLLGLTALFIAFQAGLSVSRSVVLFRDRTYDVDLYHHDPIADIIANYVIAAASVFFAFAALRWHRAWSWWSSLALLTVASLEAVHLVVVDFGGASFIPLLVTRGSLVIVLSLAEVRDQFA